MLIFQSGSIFLKFRTNIPTGVHKSLWDLEKNKLYQIKNKIGESANVFRNKRRHEVILARFRIGHTYINHSYLLKHEDKPWCVGCHLPYTDRMH